MRDRFPGGEGPDPELTLRQLANKTVDFFILRIHSNVDIMAEAFKKVYTDTGRQFDIYPMSKPSASFIPAVIKSIQLSMTASRLRGDLKPAI